MKCPCCLGILQYGYLTLDSGMETRVAYCTECSSIVHVGTMVKIDSVLIKARAIEHKQMTLKGGD